MPKSLKVGPSKWSPGGFISFARYSNGEIAIRVLNERDRQPEAMATVALEGAPAAATRKGVWLKGWTENEGIPAALEKAGICKLTGETFPTGFCEAEFAELTPEALEAISDQVPSC